MVGRNYVLRQPPPPSGPKLFFDQTIIPGLIDAAGAVEGQMERLAVKARGAPFGVVGAAFAVGWAVSRAMCALARERRRRG